jgi:hypothetical protein
VVTVNINAANITAVGAQGTYLGYTQISGTSDYVYYLSVTGGGLATPVTIAVTGEPSLPALNVATPVNTSNVSAPVGPATPCYATGTHIRTPRGDVPIEELAVGDTVSTASGQERTIKWIGYRRTDCKSHINRATVLPVRIRHDAVGSGVPLRDLVVSPGHRLLFDDVLVPASHLINGSTITQDYVDEITYWHVELDSHDILVAEGLSAESYLESQNRMSFDNGGNIVDAYPDFSAKASSALCAPLIMAGPRLHAIKKWLLARAEHLGARMIADAGVRLVAGHLDLTPVEVHDRNFKFEVPENARDLWLLSRSAVPGHLDPRSNDMRELGVYLWNLKLDGREVSLDILDGLTGWHHREPTGRWTGGKAALPPARILEISIVTLPSYGIDPEWIDQAGDAPIAKVAMAA